MTLISKNNSKITFCTRGVYTRLPCSVHIYCLFCVTKNPLFIYTVISHVEMNSVHVRDETKRFVMFYLYVSKANQGTTLLFPI